MKKRRLLQFLVLLGVVCCALPALAATVTLNQDHALTISWTGSAALEYGGHLANFTEAAANGNATPDGSPPENASASTWPTASLPATASIGTTYLNATAYLNAPSVATGNAITVNLNQSMQGLAPAPFGGLYLQTVNYLSLFFQADFDGGDAVLRLADSLTNMRYDLTGSPPPPAVEGSLFLTITALTDFTANVFSSLVVDTVAQNLLTDPRAQDPYITDFNGVIASISGFDITLTGLGAGELFSLDLSLTSSLEATSANVPVPPAVWLFGSGLAGLMFYRRRFTRAK